MKLMYLFSIKTENPYKFIAWKPLHKWDHNVLGNSMVIINVKGKPGNVKYQNLGLKGKKEVIPTWLMSADYRTAYKVRGEQIKNSGIHPTLWLSSVVEVDWP